MGIQNELRSNAWISNGWLLPTRTCYICIYCWGLFNNIFSPSNCSHTWQFMLFLVSFLFFRNHRFLTDCENIFSSFHDILSSFFSVSVRNKFYTLVALGIGDAYFLSLNSFFFRSHWTDNSNVVYQIYLSIVYDETPNLIYIFITLHSSL